MLSRRGRDDSGCAVYDNGFMPHTSSALIIVVLPTAITELFRETFYHADKSHTSDNVDFTDYSWLLDLSCLLYTSPSPRD